MRHTVIGTAGHVDHGKSALIKALTGTDPDRLQEEKEREMTIDLGFAFLGDNITFIDVPGHEKFIKNMLSGVATVDAVMLIIAADDGFMPQTEEHLDIIELIKVQRSMVVLTKIDMVDAEWLDLIEDDVRQRLEGTSLENSPLFRVDSLSGKGVENLKQAIFQLAEEIPPKPEHGIFRMYADRVFSIKGAGTVIAGTVLSGQLKESDKAQILPQNIEVRARRIQVHNREVSITRTGDRAAINLQGVKKEQVQRGDLLATPGYFKPTYMLNALYYHLKSASKPLANRQRVRVHLGTAEYLARAIPLEKQSIPPGQKGYLQLRLETPAVCEIGDNYVIRNYTPGRTIGGGQILEVNPKKLKYLPEQELKVLEKLSQGTPDDLIEQQVRRQGFLPQTAASVSRDISRPENEVAASIEKLIRTGQLIRLKKGASSWVVHQDVFEKTKEKLLGILDEFHHKQPYRLGMKRSEIAGKLFGKIESGLYDAFLDTIAKSAEIVQNGVIVHKKEHQIKFTPKQEELAQKIVQIYWEKAYVTPEFDELVKQLGAPPNEVSLVIQGLTDRGDLMDLGIQINRALIFHTKRIEEAKNIILKLFEKKNEIAFFEAKEALNSTRKFATPILNYLDQIGLTVRVGDVRQLKTRKT